ncbi:MAG: SRPBCC domain-containing protein [Flavobacteriales bacterium]
MPAILHDFVIKAAREKVFAAISEPAQVDNWWSLECAGTPTMGGEYRLFFGEAWDWRARVSRCEPGRAFEWEMTNALPDWVGTRVGFELTTLDEGTKVRFYHSGWATESEHFRISSYCWAMLLRLLKVYVERGEVMPYAQRVLL